jgi:hypothetical protein
MKSLANYLLGSSGAEMTLHEAIVVVLGEAGTALSAAEIGAAVNERKLYVRADRQPVPTNQIHARVSNRPRLFTRTDDGIRLA